MWKQGQNVERKFWYCDDEQDEEFEAPIETESIKRKYLPPVLTRIMCFDSQNQNMNFYRESKKLGTKTPLIMTHGWRITQVTPEQESLILFCFALFEAQLKAPLGFFLLRQAVTERSHSARQYSNFLWMETTFMITSVTRGEFQENIEYSYYNFAKDKLVPLIATFIDKNITWSKIIDQNYKQNEVIDHFQLEIVKPILILFSQFRIGEDYSLNQEYEKEKKLKKEMKIE